MAFPPKLATKIFPSEMFTKKFQQKNIRNIGTVYFVLLHKSMGMQSVNIKKQVLTTITSAQSNDIGIWKDGCIEILEVMLKRDLIEYPFAWVYIWVGLILALVELITVFLACSYVAQINRSSQKNLAWFFSMIICSPFFLL